MSSVDAWLRAQAKNYPHGIPVRALREAKSAQARMPKILFIVAEELDSEDSALLEAAVTKGLGWRMDEVAVSTSYEDLTSYRAVIACGVEVPGVMVAASLAEIRGDVGKKKHFWQLLQQVRGVVG